MNYFTQDLLERYGSENERIARVARAEFEKASALYYEHLDGIKEKLPPKFLQMLERFTLHDALVMPAVPVWKPESFWLFEREVFPVRSVTLFETPDEKAPRGDDETRTGSYLLPVRLDPAADGTLILNYLGGMIHATRQERVREGSRHFHWLYDEVDTAQTEEGDRFVHRILFTNGFEVEIRFRDFDFATMVGHDAGNGDSAGDAGASAPKKGRRVTI